MNDTQNDRGPELNFAIDNLYSVFAVTKKPKTILYCTCCMEDWEVKNLLDKDLKSLTMDDLEKYIRCLFQTVGALEDFQYFLPRIFDLACNMQPWVAENEITFAKLNCGEWKLWEEPKKAAINQFLHAFCKNEITKSEPDTSAMLCSIGQCEDDLGEYLNLITANNALKELLNAEGDTLKNNMLSNPFWEDRPEQMKQVVNWLKSETVQNMILTLYDNQNAWNET